MKKWSVLRLIGGLAAVTVGLVQAVVWLVEQGSGAFCVSGVLLVVAYPQVLSLFVNGILSALKKGNTEEV